MDGADGAAGADGKDGTAVIFPLKVYADYPVTINPANTTADLTGRTTSVSYGGQMERHALRESVKSLLGNIGDDIDNTDEAAIAAKIYNYLDNKDDSGDFKVDTIVAPVNKNDFVMKETMFSELSSPKSLYDESFAGGQAEPIEGADANVTLGVPGDLTSQEVLDLWVANFARNYAANSGATYPGIDFDNGFEWNQMFAKYLMGSVFYNKAVDKYLDEYITAGEKPNSQAYSGGNDHYTGKEHSWDEGFGYFGAAANYGLLDPNTNYNIKKQADGLAEKADWDMDNEVSIYTEYTSGPAYYAADADRNGPTTYGQNIMAAWIAGREVIADAVDSDGYARDLKASELANLDSYADQIRMNWEKTIAEAVYKYAGLSYNDINDYNANPTEKELRDYIHHWSEGKGMMLALQYGGPKAMMTKEKFEEIDNLLGFGPVLPDGSQVIGVSGNTFQKSAAGTTSLADYQAALKQVQMKLDEFYELKTKQYMIED